MATGTWKNPGAGQANYLTYSEYFETYSTGNEIYAKKQGSVVFLAGVVKPAVNIDTTNVVQIATLPQGFRPAAEVNLPQIGTQNYTWTLRIQANGNVNCYRYGPSPYTISKGAWTPVSAVFFCV